MSIRESLNRNKAVSTLLSLVFVIGAMAFLAWWFHKPDVHITDKAFYTDDGGKTYFVDDLWKVVPFQHNGKPAYRAFVFSYANGSKDFIEYISKFDDDWAAKCNQEVADAVKAGQPPSTVVDLGSRDAVLAHTLIGKPDGSEWGGANSELAVKLKSQMAPDGSQPEPKTPD